MAEKKIQQYKKDAVEHLYKNLEENKSFIFTDFRGITVAQISKLREVLRESGAQYYIVKNNYAKIAFSKIEQNETAQFLVGPTAIAYCPDEAGVIAKALFKLADEMPVVVKGGLLSGEIYDADSVKAFSKLPSKNELIAMLMSTMQAPVTNVALVLNAVTSKLVRTLDSVREKKSTES